MRGEVGQVSRRDRLLLKEDMLRSGPTEQMFSPFLRIIVLHFSFYLLLYFLFPSSLFFFLSFLIFCCMLGIISEIYIYIYLYKRNSKKEILNKCRCNCIVMLQYIGDCSTCNTALQVTYVGV